MLTGNLYNKYRPANFSDVVGQNHICKLLQSQLSNGTLPNSLIFYGPRGTGKTTVSLLVANALNSSPSGLIEVNSADDGKVDDIRGLKSDFFCSPWEGDYKTYVFDEAHRITPAAFDSLLKDVEKPPTGVVFIFVTTEISKIPITIKSRCQCHCFNLIHRDVIKEKLTKVCESEGVEISRLLLETIVDASDGSLREALVVLSSVLSRVGTEVESDIIKSMSIVNSSMLSEFVAHHLFCNFVDLQNCVKMFSNSYVDTERAINKLQQFIMEAKLSYLGSLDRTKLLTDPIKLLNTIKENYKTISSLYPGAEKRYICTSLGNMYDLSLKLEKDLKYTANKDARLYRFVVELAETWK